MPRKRIKNPETVFERYEITSLYQDCVLGIVHNLFLRGLENIWRLFRLFHRMKNQIIIKIVRTTTQNKQTPGEELAPRG